MIPPKVKWALRLLVLTFVWLAFSGTAHAQQNLFPCTQSQNVGFWIPPIGNSTVWGSCINQDLSMLDLLLGGTQTLAVGSASPSVAGFSNWLTANTSSTTISNFTNGFPGQTIRVICGTGDTFTQITNSANISLTATFSCASATAIELTLVGSKWIGIGGIGGGGSSGLSGMTPGQVPRAATVSTVTSSIPIQGTDTSLLSSGTISGAAAPLCTDASGGATTSGCPIDLSGMTAGQVPKATTASTITSSIPIQGTDANLLSSGTISGTAAPLCTDASGGATTSGCPTSSVSVNSSIVPSPNFNPLPAAPAGDLNVTWVASSSNISAYLTPFVGSGASHAPGLVPDPGSTAGTARFLNENGTWQTPSGAGNVSTSGSPAQFQTAVFASGTTILGIAPGTAGLPFLSNGASANPSYQALPLASLVVPSAAGDEVCGNSTPAWADCVPGVAGRTVTIATDTIGAGVGANDRLNSVLYNSASAVAVTLTSAASLGNNFAFKACNENTGTATLTPGAGQINGSGSLALAEGQCISVNSPDNVNYIASISNGAFSTDTSLSVTRSPFGVQLGLSATSFPFSGGPAGTSFQDVVETAAPANPAAGNCRLYVDSTSGFLAGLNSTGASCVSSGGSTAWSALGNPSGTLSLTMNANVSSFLYNAATGAGVNMWTETDTANNTGTGFLHRIGTAAGSAASALSLFATGSSTNTFGNPFAEVISNPTAATASQAQSSPKWEICGRTWSGGTPADTPECFSWQVVPSSNVSNPTVSIALVHESGTSGVQTLNFPLANFTMSIAAIAVGSSIVNTTNNGVTTIQGGKDNSGASANLVARGGAVAGGSSAVAAGGGLFEGGNDASTSATSSAGGVELLAGAATGATQGLQGLLATVPVYVKGATVTQWNLETESAQMTVADAGASPGYWLCIAEVVGTNTVQCINDGETAVNASAAVTLGHTVCATTTAGKVTDSGGTAACTLGTGVGVVMATSGTWKFPDGTSVTASTTLPIIQIVRD